MLCVDYLVLTACVACMRVPSIAFVVCCIITGVRCMLRVFCVLCMCFSVMRMLCVCHDCRVCCVLVTIICVRVCYVVRVCWL